MKWLQNHFNFFPNFKPNLQPKPKAVNPGRKSNLKSMIHYIQRMFSKVFVILMCLEGFSINKISNRALEKLAWVKSMHVQLI